MVPLLYLSKLEEINTARNYSWGSAVLAFLYRELCHASLKGKAAIGGALQLLQIWAWSRIIPLSPGLGVERLYMDQVQVNIDRFLPAAPYGAIWNCRHNFTRTFIWQPYDMDSDRIMAYAADFYPRIVEVNMSSNFLCHCGNSSSRAGSSPIWDETKYSRNARFSGHDTTSDLP
ncbi:UNVERIFIED_CONTAM: hypothetical protein Sradi_6322500 [Sesamum radiatum]|uniref:Aminotransferase-like plant mobile domain-containing protein n=1 Tax=Sesamum radiatum TaxID=300843 RepID=A0AAW2KCB9_SESRA